MALWRFGRGWSEAVLKRYLAELADRSPNFDSPFEEMTRENGWTVDGAESPLGVEPPGPPLADGLYARARQGIINYDFSDPGIVVGHFDPRVPLRGRDMLLEIRVFGFRFLNGVRVHSVREEADEKLTLFGFRYDTLKGHIERGCEWFVLVKDHETGEVRFRIEAHWQIGDFPNWWTRLGFKLFGEHFRVLWRHRAPGRLRELAKKPVQAPPPPAGQLAHRGGQAPHRSGQPPGRAGLG